MNSNWIYNEGDVLENFLKSRGFNSKEEVDYYFNFSEKNLRTKYKDMDKVVSRIAKAIKNKEHICIYGDYDCDGITATSILVLALRNLGVEVNYFINNRFNEGYGMNVKGLERLMKLYPETELIITCDNGIAAQEGIQTALDIGVDVVCTDHHLQKGELIVPTVDEWRNDEDEKLREECCGAEIARRTMLNLYHKLHEDDQYVKDLIVFSGIATVADVVKFTPANHWIVKKCLEELKNPKFPVLSLIKEEMSVDEADEETLGFKIGPLMNCLSRVTGSPDEMVEILTAKYNGLDTYLKVKEAVGINEDRKNMTAENLEIAKVELNENDECIILSGYYDAGIAGLVASSIVENYNRPCICLVDDGKILHGSARSYLDFHLKNALDKCADLLETYGGHAGAAGLTLKKKNLKAFKKRMNQLVKESGVLEKEVDVRIDYKCSISNMFDENVQKLMSLAPFGEGFEKPKIVYYGRYSNLKYIPKNAQKHVTFTLEDNTGSVKAVWWNAVKRWEDINPNINQEIAVMGVPRIDYFNEQYFRKLYIEDIKINE